jgi:hypothetical protein
MSNQNTGDAAGTPSNPILVDTKGTKAGAADSFSRRGAESGEQLVAERREIEVGQFRDRNAK